MRRFMITALLFLIMLSSINPRLSHARMNTYDLLFTYRFTPRSNTEKIRFIAIIPRNRSNRQTVSDLNFSVKPYRVFMEKGTKYAEFIIVKPHGNFEINISAKIRLYDYDLNSAYRAGGFDRGTDQDLYLINETYLEKDASSIMAKASKLNGRNRLETVRKIYNFVLKTMSYGGFNPGQTGAEKALKLKSGDCTEYSDLMTALCRAKKIPARVVDGYITSYGNDTPKHNWVEVYFPEYGWVPFDPLLGDLKKTGFERLKVMYIFMSSTRNDPLVAYGHFYAYWYQGGAVEIQDSFSAKQGE